MQKIIVVIGLGQIGQAITRRVGVGKHVLLADLRPDNANAAAEALGNAGYEVSVVSVDVSSREAVQMLVETATALGAVSGLSHAAGVSPSQAAPATILKVDLLRYGTGTRITVRHWYSKNLATSSPTVELVSLSHRSLGIVFLHSVSNRTKPWPQHPRRSCLVCTFSNRSR